MRDAFAGSLMCVCVCEKERLSLSLSLSLPPLSLSLLSLLSLSLSLSLLSPLSSLSLVWCVVCGVQWVVSVWSDMCFCQNVTEATS